MKEVKLSKREVEMVERYYDADDTDIYDAYDRPSKAMRDAFRRCVNMKCEMNGNDLRITGHSSYRFSCAFRYFNNGVEFLRYITKDHNYDINLKVYRQCYDERYKEEV